MAVSSDLRKTVKSITTHPLFSSKWFAMLGSLQQMTETAVSEQQTSGKVDGESLQTLWERNEVTVRYLLEEGKLNLCLRLMTDFKTMQRNEQFASALSKAKEEEPHYQFMDLPVIKVKAALYEQCIGVLLSCAFCNVESLQTLDMPHLFQHMQQTFIFALTHPEMIRSPDADRRQEVLCIHYVAEICAKIDLGLSEDQIMELVQELGIVNLLIENLVKYHTLYSKATQKQACLALSGIMGTETFKSRLDGFLTDVEHKKLLVQLDEQFFKEQFPDYATKKTVRPLLDCVSKVKYQVK
jgi:hypothetical protein